MYLIDFIPFLGFFALPITIIYFIYLIKQRNNKLEIEKNKTFIYNILCGGRFNGLNLTSPFVRLTIYEKIVIISYSKNILLNISDITKLEIKRHFFSKALHIMHKNNNVPKNIIIWSSSCEEIKNIIKGKMKNDA